MNTYLSDELLLGRGKGTSETTDGYRITWISTDLGRSVDNLWVFYGIMLLNNTQDIIGLPKSTAPLNEPELVWLLE